MLADIDEAALNAATDALTAAGHDAIGVVCDVSDEAQAAAAVQEAVARFGRLDMAFNNAGIQVPPTRRPRTSTASTPSTCVASGRR
jgi:NAD(P)-dependent dehydrogenase (short-subunit alcohol dehydrogenase family)